jgi:uncharacterized protein (TIGR03067 family)
MKFGMFSAMVALGSLALSVGCSSSKAPPQEDLSKFHGDWSAIEVVEKGRKMDSKVAQTLVVTMGSGTFHRVEMVGNRLVSHGRCGFSVDSKKTPGDFDLVHLDGDNIGKTAKGIFALENGELKLCIAQLGKPRPSSFAADDQNTQLILKKK